jgi:hypothetical protein
MVCSQPDSLFPSPAVETRSSIEMKIQFPNGFLFAEQFSNPSAFPTLARTTITFLPIKLISSVFPQAVDYEHN